METPTPDDDLELLEQHLDGALPADEALALSRRLAVEPALATVLERLRAERAVRQAVWASLEPDEASAQVAAARVVFAAARQGGERRTAVRSAVRVAAVAAGFAVAFLGGWVARSQVGAVPNPGGAAAPAALPAAGSDQTGPAVAFQVALTDESGNVIAVQRFADPRAAREFADDIGRWQSRPGRSEAGGLAPVSDAF